MINNFLIINCIGKDDKLGLRINKDFFIHVINKEDNMSENLVSEISEFLLKHKVQINQNFSVIVNQGPGSYSGVRIALSVAKAISLANKAILIGFKSKDVINKNYKNLIKLVGNKSLIKPIYSS